MKNITLFLFIALFVVCSSSELLSQSESQIKDLEKQIIELRVEVSFLKGKIESIEKSLANLITDRTQTEVKNTSTDEKTTVKPKTNNQQTTGRCQAFTKKGKQCSRNAKPGSIYCWQHGG